MVNLLVGRIGKLKLFFEIVSFEIEMVNLPMGRVSKIKRNFRNRMI